MVMSIVKSIRDFIIGPSKISRLSFIWRTVLFTVSIPESLNLLFGDLATTFGSQPIWIMLLISMAILVSVIGSLSALFGRMNDLRMSGYWLLTILFPPAFMMLWIYLALKPAPMMLEFSSSEAS